MKKTVIILLIMLVLGIVGYFVYNEIKVTELTYVSSFENDNEEGRYSVKRLYSSNIDVDSFNEKVDKLVLVEFTEEDILAAALEAGTPEFYPAFHFLTYRPMNIENTVYMDLTAVQELAPGQEDANFSMTNVKLEILTTGVSITDAEAVGVDSLNRTVNEAILKNEDGTAMAMGLNDYGSTKLTLKGVTGTVTLQYTFDVRKNSIIPTTVLENCLVMVRVNIITNNEDETEITYQLTPATTVDEYIEQE